jgi:hypothetical protein
VKNNPIKHHPIENLEHALACNSGGMTEAGHKHLIECAREVVEWAKELMPPANEAASLLAKIVNQSMKESK